MEKIKEIVKVLINKKVLIITLFVWLLLNFTGYENIYFIESSLKRIVTMKILHFFFLYTLIFILKYIYDHCKEERTKHGIILFGIYFVIMFIILLLIWPGAWTTDDITVVNKALNYGLYPWQHMFTSLIYIMFLKTLPFATGVLIMQIIIDGMIIGYCISTIGDLFIKNKRKKVICEALLFIPMLFPPVIFQVLSGWRMSLYMFIELFLIVRFIEIYYNKKNISLMSLIILSILVIIISSWRSEGIYYLLIYLVMLIIFFKKWISRKSAIITFIICTLFTLGIGKFNNFLIGNDDYLLTAVVEPVKALVLNADKNKDNKELKEINAIFDINLIYENPNIKGATLFWNGLVKPNYNKKEYIKFFGAYLKLFLKYPSVSFEAMSKIFLRASGVILENGKKSLNNIALQSLDLYNKKEPGRLWSMSSSKLKDPINQVIRNDVIKILSCVDKNENINILYYIFWNLFIPLFLAIISLIYKIIKKDWFMVFIMIAVLVKVPIIFSTAPLGIMLYYLSTYLICYFIFVACYVQYVAIKQGENKNERQKIK